MPTKTEISRADPSGNGDGFAPFFMQTKTGRMRIICSQCNRTFYPTPLAGISRYAGSSYRPDCGTDFRNWVYFQKIMENNHNHE
jgi:hypothetical protein